MQTSGELSPGQPLPGTGGSTPELTDVLFGDAVQVGDRGVVEVPEGSVIYEVTSRVPFDPDLFEQGKEELRQEVLVQRQTEYRQSIVQRLRESQQIEINFELLQEFNI
jgi:hypothetical protein